MQKLRVLSAGKIASIFAFACAISLLVGCATSRSLPPAINASGDAVVRQGQAVWKPGEDQPEITGDVVITSRGAAGSSVQFSKTIPIVSGRLTAQGWEFEAIPEKKKYAGRGNPPRRIVWLQLLQVLEGAEIPGRWTVARPSEGFIVLEDSFRGERLEVMLQR